MENNQINSSFNSKFIKFVVNASMGIYTQTDKQFAKVILTKLYNGENPANINAIMKQKKYTDTFIQLLITEYHNGKYRLSTLIKSVKWTLEALKMDQTDVYVLTLYIGCVLMDMVIYAEP